MVFNYSLRTQQAASLQLQDFFIGIARFMSHSAIFLQRGVLVFILMLWIVMPAVAQESTEEATVPDFQISGDLNFPVDMTFGSAIGLTDSELARMTLRIRFLSQQSETVINFPEDVPYTFSDEFTSSEYVWLLDAANAPLLFEEVTYLWQVEDTSGRVYEQTGTFIFEDERATWLQSNAGNPDDGLAIIAPESLIDFDPAQRVSRIRRIYDRLQAETRAAASFKYAFYPQGLPFPCNPGEDGEPAIQKFVDGETIDLPCDEAVTRAIYEKSGYTLIISEDDRDFDIPFSTWIDAFYADLWADADIPAWFRYGLERLYTGDLSRAYFIAQGYLRNNDPLSVETMENLPDSDDSDAVDIWQAQSYGMMLYTARLAGVDAIFDLALTIGDADSFTAAYETIIGASLQQVIAEWSEWIYSNEAVEDYVYRIYLPTTLTPTFTPTASDTPLPPTLTFTPTLTNTPRPPTRTPRPTAIPLTPTPTPLPAQSFTVRATPTPGTDNTSDGIIPGMGQTQSFVLIGGGIFALLVLIAGLIWARRG